MNLCSSTFALVYLSIIAISQVLSYPHKGRTINNVAYIEQPTRIEITYSNQYYREDGSGVYFDDKKINRADSSLFQRIDANYPSYAKDNYNVYEGGRLITDADPQSFYALDSSYAKDNKNVYYNRNKIANADIELCELIGYSYAKDKFNVYEWDRIIIVANSQPFELLKWRYEKDNENAYYEGKKIADADAQSFVWIFVQQNY